MKNTLEKEKNKINKNVLEFFNEKFGNKETPVDFQTCWPISKWDTLHTYTRSFIVELKLSTGKVIDIIEEF